MTGRDIHKYGQHFLVSSRVIAQIVDAADVLKATHLVEIGPGQGALTQALVKRGRTPFTAVEIDPDMVHFLHQNLPSGAAVNIVEANFLNFALDTLPAVPTQFVSNLPYIDAAAILDKVLSWPHFQTAVFMFQREQAQKITAKPGSKNYAALSVLSQLRARVNLICTVGRGCFNPPPRVESCVLSFEKIPSPQSWPAVRNVVTAAFLHRRKTLLNALLLAGYERAKITSALLQLQQPLTVRPEQLSPAHYAVLASYL